MNQLMGLTHKDMADLVLRRSEKTFRNEKKKLYGLGMPAPLDLPGKTIWDRAEVEAWLASRRQRVATARPRGQVARQVAAAHRRARDEAAPPPDAAAQPAKRGRGRPPKLAAAVLEGGAE